MRQLIDTLREEKILESQDLMQLLTKMTEEDRVYLHEQARQVKEATYGNTVYIRGLIEVSNYCRNDCYYCGIRRSNRKAQRYRLTHSQILQCCEQGYELGFRTFVLQGGEDGYYTDDMLENIIGDMKEHYPDCAVTLSLGERSYDSYLRLYRAGADRYLLRHETADEDHYGMLHPPQLSWKKRMECLENLKKIGYQAGTGFMVGSPGQKVEHLVKDLQFIGTFQPQMVGIGPFIHHQDTPFAKELSGDITLTVDLLAMIRLMLPKVLLPATTALATLHPQGRERGIQAGANVVMPNLSPLQVRDNYMLYDNKANTGDEAAEALEHLKQSMENIGCQVVTARGDFPSK